MADRLTVGVAARLSRYLQVLTQARKMGKAAHLLAGDRGVHEHQRDADPPRPVGVRQVRQARRRLQHRLAARRDPQDPPHAGAAQHRAHRRRPARPGDRELADLRRARHQHRRRLRQGSGEDRRPVGNVTVSEYGRLADAVRDKNIIVGVLAVPADGGAERRRRSRRRRREDHLQLLRGAARDARRRHGAHVEPGGRAAVRAVLPPDVASG